jgi:P27 family predicted phage terminase small subunit
MAIRGRKPKPTLFKILDGDRKDRINPHEPRPAAVPPPPPADLDPKGREAWDRIAPKLAELGVLTEVDGEALALYCKNYAIACRAEGQIKRYGVTVKEGSVRRPNPAVAIAHRAHQIMTSILTEFGLTPSSRSRVKVDATPRDALGDFLARRKA